MTDEPQGTTDSAEVRIRRAPRIPVFLVLGAVAGALVTLILTASFPADPTVGFGALFGYFAIYGVPAGVVLGALVALIVDRVSTRRARRVTMERTTVDRLPDEDE
jgi:NhaP-type Na+/H+ or K+/H+ antiporter